jgi:hypothetical protein
MVAFAHILAMPKPMVNPCKRTYSVHSLFRPQTPSSFAALLAASLSVPLPSALPLGVWPGQSENGCRCKLGHSRAGNQLAAHRLPMVTSHAADTIRVRTCQPSASGWPCSHSAWEGLTSNSFCSSCCLSCASSRLSLSCSALRTCRVFPEVQSA